MPSKTQLIDGGGTDKLARIVNGGSLLVTDAGYPAKIQQRVKPFRQYFTTDGTATGTNDMAVDGSVNSVDYYIKAHPENDRYIARVSILVAYGASAQINEFGDAAALTSGIRFFYTSSRGEVDIDDAIKQNQALMRISCDDFLRTNWEVRYLNSATDYGYIVSVDFREMMSSNGIKLDSGTNQRLIFRIRDNMPANITFMNAIAYGFDRFE